MLKLFSAQIKHQTETITQLREEASQWKNQLLRFEETSRREVQDWKEQYLRAEQERFRLSARLDQLIAEQLEVRLLRLFPVPQPISSIFGAVVGSRRRSSTPVYPSRRESRRRRAI